MALLKQSTARNLMILMIDSADHITGKAALTLTITASQDGGAFASITPTVTDRGTGWYNLALTTAHTNTLGDYALHITATGADPHDSSHQVVLDLPGASVSSVTGSVGSVAGAVGSIAAAGINRAAFAADTGFQSSRSNTAQAGAAGTITLDAAASATTDFYKDQLIILTGGTGVGQMRVCTGYNGSTKVANVTPNWAVNPDATTTFACADWGWSPGVSGNVNGSVASVTGAVGSVTGAVGSVTGAVGSVTGNVGGNVVGSVASVTGAVGSVTGAVGSVTAAVSITSNVKKNQALNSFEFLLTDSTTHAPKTAAAGVIATRSIDGAAFAAGTLSAVTEIGNGIYAVNFAAADLNGNVILLRVTATAADDTFERIVTVP